MEESRTPVPERVNRAHWFAGRVREVLDDVVAGGIVSSTLSKSEAVETIRDLAVARAQMDALLLAVLHQADTLDVGEEVGATSTAAWLMHTIQVVPGQAHGLVRLAKRLQNPSAPTGQPHDLVATREALTTGVVDADRARIVVEAVDGLPDYVDVGERVRAEEHLLEDAARLHPRDLKKVARHLLAVIDPDAADAELAKKLEAEEEAAARKTMLRFRDDGQGVCHGEFRVPTLYGAMMAKYLDALVSPKRPDAIPRQVVDENGRAVQLHPSQVLGEALCQLLERFPAGRLPKAGRLNATVVVTMELEKLLAGIGVATLDTGHHITAAQARRLACAAGVIPAVLGTDSEVLDLGRKARFHSTAQRLALTLRDQSCTAAGCDRPAAWCHAHHDVPWSLGGPTDVRHARLLCPRHHTMAHHPSYHVGDAGEGKVLITRLSRNRQ